MTKNFKKVLVGMLAGVMVLGTAAGSFITATAATKKPSKVSISSFKANKAKTKATLKWKKAKNAKKYEVQLKKGAAKYKKVKTTKSKKYSFKLKNNVKYKIRVRGLNGKKKGKFSKVKTIKIKLVKKNGKTMKVAEIAGEESTDNASTVDGKQLLKDAKNMSYKELKKLTDDPDNLLDLSSEEIKELYAIRDKAEKEYKIANSGDKATRKKLGITDDMLPERFDDWEQYEKHSGVYEKDIKIGNKTTHYAIGKTDTVPLMGNTSRPVNVQMIRAGKGDNATTEITGKTSDGLDFSVTTNNEGTILSYDIEDANAISYDEKAWTVDGKEPQKGQKKRYFTGNLKTDKYGYCRWDGLVAGVDYYNDVANSSAASSEADIRRYGGEEAYVGYWEKSYAKGKLIREYYSGRNTMKYCANCDIYEGATDNEMSDANKCWVCGKPYKFIK